MVHFSQDLQAEILSSIPAAFCWKRGRSSLSGKLENGQPQKESFLQRCLQNPCFTAGQLCTNRYVPVAFWLLWCCCCLNSMHARWSNSSSQVSRAQSRILTKGFHTLIWRRRAIKSSWWSPVVSFSLTNGEQDNGVQNLPSLALHSRHEKSLLFPSENDSHIYGSDMVQTVIYAQKLLTGILTFCFSWFKFRRISLLK